MLQEINYTADGVAFKGKVARPDQKGDLPAVMVAHDWGGVNDLSLNAIERLKAKGYIGVAIDLYGGGVAYQTNEDKAAAMGPLKEDRSLLRHRLLAAYEAVTKLEGVKANQIAIMGFCFGGLCALDLARSGAPIKGAISFHGLLDAPGLKSDRPQTSPVLVLHGHDDPMVPPEQVLAFEQEMSAAKVDWQVHTYGGTVHAFANPAAQDASFGTVYSEKAAYRAWKNAFAFLEETL